MTPVSGQSEGDLDAPRIADRVDRCARANVGAGCIATLLALAVGFMILLDPPWKWLPALAAFCVVEAVVFFVAGFQIRRALGR